MSSENRSFAVISGASTGIGFELAKCCAEKGFDLLVAADEPEIHEAAHEFRALGVQVEAVEADLATQAGVDKLYGYQGSGCGCIARKRRQRAWPRFSRSGLR